VNSAAGSLLGMEQSRFAARRSAFMEQIGDTIAIIPAGRLQTRNDDVEHAFRQDSEFFFLTGFSEPDSIAVFDPSHATERYVLFVRPRDPEMEAWNGRRAGIDGATNEFGANAAHNLDEFDIWLRNRVVDRTAVSYSLGGSSETPGPLSAIPSRPDSACSILHPATAVSYNSVTCSQTGHLGHEVHRMRLPPISSRVPLNGGSVTDNLGCQKSGPTVCPVGRQDEEARQGLRACESGSKDQLPRCRLTDF
jgi:hypothetical protein